MSNDRRPVEGPVIEYRDDEARYRATFQQAAIGIVHTAPDGAILDVNPAFCLMLGYERADLLFKRISEVLVTPAAADASEAVVQRLLARDAAEYSAREEYRHRNGASVWLQRTVVMATDALGDPYFIHFAENVTARKRADEEQRVKDLRFRRTLESALDCIVTTDAEGHIVEFNPMAEEVFRYPREKVLGRKLSEVLVPRHLRRRHEMSMRRLLTDEQPAMLNRRVESVALRGDGTTIPIELAMQRITDTDPPLFTGFLRDISERKQSEARILRLNRLYRTLSHTSALTVRATDRDTLFRGICRIAREHGFIMPWFGLLDPATGVLNLAAHVEDEPLDLPPMSVRADAPDGAGPRGTAAREGRIVICNDVRNDPEWERGRERYERYGTAALAALPLMISGRVIGIFNLESPVAGYFDDDIVQLLHEMVGELTYALERLELQAAHDRALSALQESEERFRQLAENIPQIFWLTDPTLETALYMSPASEMLTGRAANEPQARYAAWLGAIHPDDRQRVLAARQEATVAGTYDVEYRIADPHGATRWVSDRAFPIRDAAGNVVRIAGIASDITESRQAQERLAHLAHYDQLTNLPNRGVFYERLSHALALAARHRWIVGVMFIDLDRFKTVNDTMGHSIGDALLRQIAVRLTDCVRGEDCVSRLSGDEFAIVLARLTDIDDAGLVAEKVLERLRESYQVDGIEVVVSASIGITLYPDDGDNADVLMRNADVAMYNAKSRGRDNYQFYTAELNARALARMQLEARLRGALERGEFVLHFQPKVRLESGRVCGFEALLRWAPPGDALVSPAEFIPVLEETGLITPVGEWVVGAACRQIAAWRAAGLTPVPIAINLSARQLRRAGFPDVVARMLAQHAIAPHLIEVEITESSLMENPDEAHAALVELKSLGVSLAIDDFGTGYSSLAYLKRFPFDTLKIDRSFVRDIPGDADDAMIARTIIALAHSLSLEVVAEGVETEEQLGFLLAHRCDNAQGYLFARPLPGEAATAVLGSVEPLYRRTRPVEFGQAPAVLVLDDDIDDLILVQRLLQRDGYQVLIATTAGDALDVLASHNVVAVVSDQKMPGTSGIEFFSRVKRSHAGVERIMLSGDDDPRTIAAAINEGAVHKYYVKGRDEGALREALRRVVRRSQPAQNGDEPAADAGPGR
jgi:diguanylate cyclase (GGDEF)-like protein/PAS domain S-box-containing protein